jgi:hypothetical protein
MATKKKAMTEATENNWEEAAWKIPAPIERLRVPVD